MTLEQVLERPVVSDGRAVQEVQERITDCFRRLDAVRAMLREDRNGSDCTTRGSVPMVDRPLT